MKTLRLLIPAIMLLAFAGCNQEKDYLVTIGTDYGDMKVLLYDETPLHKENFLKLAKEGFYDSTTFHRVIQNFMVQGGDPNSKNDNPTDDGQGGPGYTIPAEINPKLKHVKGAVAAARLGDNVNPKKESSGSQFYIVHNNAGTPNLDGGYTVFGQVVEGLDVIDKIAKVNKGYADRPVNDVKMWMKVEHLSKKKITEMTGYVYPEKPEEKNS